MKKITSVLLFALIAFALTSCGSLKNVSIDEVQQAKVRAQSGAKVTVEVKVKVNNPTCHRLVLRKVTAEILHNGYQFADVRLKKKVKVPAHSNQYYSVFIEFELIDFMSVITGTVDLTQLDDTFTATGFVKGGTLLFSKKYRFTDMPMSQLQGLLYGTQIDDEFEMEDIEE